MHAHPPNPSSLLPSPKGEVGQTYAIGSERQRSVLEVAADVLALHAAPPAGQLAHVRDRAFNDRRQGSRVGDGRCSGFGLLQEQQVPRCIERQQAHTPSSSELSAARTLPLSLCHACRHFVKDAQLEALGWRERTPWGEGLRRTVEWYRRHASDWWEPGEHSALRVARAPASPAAACHCISVAPLAPIHTVQKLCHQHATAWFTAADTPPPLAGLLQCMWRRL